MLRTEWVEIFNKNKENLRKLVQTFHPSAEKVVEVAGEEVVVDPKPPEGSFPITAHSAELACAGIRQEIAANKSGDPVARFDAAAKDMATDVLVGILNETWFGMPESTSVRALLGFHALCDLCEGIDEDEGP